MMDRRLSAISAALLLCSGSAVAYGDDDQPGAASAPEVSVTATMGTSQNLDEIVVNGIRRGDLILPTTVSSTSAYGLDLGVMDTPRNNTLLSKAQLDALNVQNPSGFSYLTSSSYTDASFGQPNIPRIRGQYADLFYNGMRESFNLNGYGAPISFNSFDSVDIVKGPASVQAGPGAGVGGSINVATKMPSLAKAFADFNLEFDSQQKRRGSLDVGTPLGSDWGVRLSFEDNGSGSYYNDMFFHQQSVFVALLGQVTPKYSVLITGGLENTTYRENDGINRVNQQLIDNGTYLTGGPVGVVFGDPGETLAGFGSIVNLTGTTRLNPRTIINEPIGDSAHALHIKGQVIQTFDATDNFSIVNNTFYDYVNRYNEVQDYYADTAKGSFTIENKTDFKVKFPIGSISNEVDAGLTYRYAHVLSIQSFLNEPVSIFDLSTNPNTFTFPDALQVPSGTYLYNAAFNNKQYGLPGRFQGVFFPIFGFLNATAESNLQDAAVFLEHRLQFTPQWSLLYGIRGDLVQLKYYDPLGGADYPAPDGTTALPQSASTGWYGLYNGNVSLVYNPIQQVSLYLTYNKAEYTQPTANDGAVATWGENPADQLRQRTLLEEGGVKFDLFDKRLFISAAGFYQERSITTGSGGLTSTLAHIHGAEVEMNFQPDPHFFATASYSYLHTTLDAPATFYNFAAQPGLNYDGAGTSLYPANLVFLPHQSFQDPGVPQQLINMLANYKHDSGLGVQANIQVTSPISVAQSGFVDVASLTSSPFSFPGLGPATLAQLQADGGYYKAPIIHWQYTANASVFYSFLDHYNVKFSIYNLANRRNLTNDAPFYGDDFLTVQPSRSYDLNLTAKF
jgi:outer membrane receptor protein involved in Fe transport